MDKCRDGKSQKRKSEKGKEVKINEESQRSQKKEDVGARKSLESREKLRFFR